MFAFQRFAAYEKAKQLYLEMTEITRKKSLNLSTRDQLQRCSLSIVLNIAEGSGRNSFKDKRRFFNIARSSIFECVAILDMLHSSGKIGEADYSRYEKLADEISRILYTVMKKNNTGL